MSSAPQPPRRSRLGTRPLLMLVIGTIAVVLVAGKAIVGGGSSAPVTATTPAAEAAAPARPQTVEDWVAGDHALALKVTHKQLLRTRPAADGRLVATIGTKTSYGTPVVLPIVAAKGDWVAVVSPYRKNNRIGWTKVTRPVLRSVRYSIAIRIHRRSIIVRRDGKVVRRITAAVGRAEHPTPPGRYAVTDGLIFKQAVRGPYGCCALVLSARQTKLPAGWTGGDRIAIHGTSDPGSIGLAASLGCLRVKDNEVRWLVRTVPPGTSVYIKA